MSSNLRKKVLKEALTESTNWLNTKVPDVVPPTMLSEIIEQLMDYLDDFKDDIDRGYIEDSRKAEREMKDIKELFEKLEKATKYLTSDFSAER